MRGKSTCSEISDHGKYYSDCAFSRNIRWGMRVSFSKFVGGKTGGIDLLKDAEQSNVGY